MEQIKEIQSTSKPWLIWYVAKLFVRSCTTTTQLLHWYLCYLLDCYVDIYTICATIKLKLVLTTWFSHNTCIVPWRFILSLYDFSLYPFGLYIYMEVILHLSKISLNHCPSWSNSFCVDSLNTSVSLYLPPSP